MNLLKGITKRFKSKKKAILKKDEYIYRDWIFSLLTFIVLVFGTVAIGIYMFVDVQNIEVIENTEGINTSAKIINQELLIETIDFYTEKEAIYNSLQIDFEGAPSI